MLRARSRQRVRVGCPRPDVRRERTSRRTPRLASLARGCRLSRPQRRPLLVAGRGLRAGGVARWGSMRSGAGSVGYRQRSAEVEHVVCRGSGGRSPGATGGREGQPRDAYPEASAGATLGEVTPTGAEAGRRGPSAEQRSDAKHLSELGMQARYHRDRHRLYAARMGSSRPFSLSKLHELKRRREISESALRHAKDAKQGASPGPRHAAGGDLRMD